MNNIPTINSIEKLTSLCTVADGEDNFSVQTKATSGNFHQVITQLLDMFSSPLCFTLNVASDHLD